MSDEKVLSANRIARLKVVDENVSFEREQVAAIANAVEGEGDVAMAERLADIVTDLDDALIEISRVVRGIS